jgi:hypothetical protein
MDIWTKKGWTLTIHNHTLGLYSARKLKLVIAEDAWELYEMAILIKPNYAEVVSIGQPIMRIPNG